MDNSNKKILIFSIGVFIVIVLLLVYGFSDKGNENFNNLKIDKDEYLVYTLKESDSGNYKQYIPALNIKGEIGEIVNNNIAEYTNSFTNENICITYEYDLNGNVLSLIIKVEDHSYVESATLLYFRSYNINLDKKEILSKETLLSYFNISGTEVLNNYNLKVEEYYNNLVNNNLIDSRNCNYNCFYNSREFTNNLDDAELYVKDGNLYVYKPYTFMSLSEEDDITYGFQVSE